MSLVIQAGAEPIPGYKLLERLGGGGFGEVWKVEAPGGLFKAIKFVHGDLHTGEGDDLRRAEQELKALKRVQAVRHPYLLSLERYDIINGKLMIVMELADCSLWDRFREHRTQGQPGIPRDTLLRYLAETAEVLDLMNSQHNLQHLDIKPQNLFLIHDHVKVADFGLVKDLEGVRATITGGVTPVYAAPETFNEEVSRFCDQYSLAIVYQELLSGQRPFAGGSVQQLIMQHLKSPPNLSALPPSDRPALAKALAKKPEDRYPTCMAMVRALHEAGLSAARQAAPSLPTALTDTENGGRVRPGLGVPLPAQDTPATIVRMRREEPADQQLIAAPQRVAPPEQTGQGCLLPALVVGLGGCGTEVVRRFKLALTRRFGGTDKVPHLRFLTIDTDPDAVNAATGDGPGFLTGDEVFLARLSRASHYLKPRRNGRSLLEGWFDPQMLYRIPRNLLTTGLRSFGRLAFCDHYRSIAQKLRGELEACAHTDGLARADGNTRLGVRTNRPRVYVVAGLAGGTGSGMALDFAYLAQRSLRFLGYTAPDVVGLLLVPAVERAPVRQAGLANAYAALTELHHYSRTDTTFAANHDDKDADFNEADPPFARCTLMSLPAAGAAGEPLRHAAEYLYRDLTTPLGRVADLRRSAAPAPAGAAPGEAPVCVQTFGLASLAWPRRQLLERCARQLCLRVVQRWTAGDPAVLRPAVREWVGEQWNKLALGPEYLIKKLQDAGEAALGKPPETVFNGLAQPFVPRSRWFGSVDTTALRPALERLEELIGPPVDTKVQGPPGRLPQALEAAAAECQREWSQRLAQLAVGLIEQPDFRLAGAEEAVQQLGAALDQVMQHYEPLGLELTSHAEEAYARLQAAMMPDRSRKRVAPAEIAESLQLYPKWRYQAIIVRLAGSIYTNLRAQVGDQVREIEYCRQRLADLRRSFEHPDEAAPAPTEEQLLPAGCQTIDQAAEKLLAGVTPEDVKTLDRRLQSLVEKQYVALLHVCLTSSGLIGNLENTMYQQAREYVAARLGAADVAELFLARYPTPEKAAAALSAAYESAKPDLAPGFSGARARELCVLTLPSGPKAEGLRQALRLALGDLEVTLTPNPEEITFYREVPKLPLIDVPQMGIIAHDAYTQSAAQPQGLPHTRIDVAVWQGADAH